MESICRKLIRGWDNPADPVTRERGGNAASVVGILINLLLFAGKFTAGVLSGSIALQADALNNLSDAGSSVISLLSFKLASRPADRGHPFGHARYEMCIRDRNHSMRALSAAGARSLQGFRFAYCPVFPEDYLYYMPHHAFCQAHFRAK